MDNGKKSFRPNSNRLGNGRRGFRNFGFIALLILFGLIIFAAYSQSGGLKSVPLTQAVSDNNKSRYSKLEVGGNEIVITKKGETSPSLKSYKDPNATLKDEGFDTSKSEVS